MQARSSVRTGQARRIVAPAERPDRRRIVAAALSAVLPGLGQAYNGRRSLAIRLAAPALVVLGLVAIAILAFRPTELVATLIVPTTLVAVLVLNLVVLGWRLFAVGHAFFDRRYEGPVGRGAIVALALLVAFVAIPHAIGGYYGYVAFSAFGKIFDPHDRDATAGGLPDASAGPTPQSGQRINVLLMGLDTGPGRAHALTDTLIVVSLDPVGKTVSMVSVPRDMVSVPLGNGQTFAPKINSLLSYAGRNEAQFPKGPTRTLENAIGALLGVPIHYYAKIDLAGFVKTVDAVGGVDVDVKNPLSDPNYGGFGVGPGWSISAGKHHLDGANALAYARIRKSEGESDFTRAARQQEILVAIRNSAIKHNLLLSLPSLLDALADTIQTDVPPDMLPQLAALADEIGGPQTIQVVIRSPLVHSGGANNPYGSVQVPDVPKIQAMARLVFSAPGTPPTPWPTPRPTKAPTPAPSASPS